MERLNFKNPALRLMLILLLAAALLLGGCGKDKEEEARAALPEEIVPSEDLPKGSDDRVLDYIKTPEAEKPDIKELRDQFIDRFMAPAGNRLNELLKDKKQAVGFVGNVKGENVIEVQFLDAKNELKPIELYVSYNIEEDIVSIYTEDPELLELMYLSVGAAGHSGSGDMLEDAVKEEVRGLKESFKELEDTEPVKVYGMDARYKLTEGPDFKLQYIELQKTEDSLMYIINAQPKRPGLILP